MHLEGLVPLELSDDIYGAVFDIHVDHKPPDSQNLGYVDRNSDDIRLELPLSGADVTIKQSRSGLSSGNQSSSTGYVCWQSASNLADWILGDKRSPLYQTFAQRLSLTVLELGSGVAGILASLLGPQVEHFIASDQKHILKLLQHNILENVSTPNFTSSTLSINRQPERKNCTKCMIDFIEFDWEDTQKGLERYRSIASKDFPDLIFATDTIYNDFLIAPFVNALVTTMGPNTISVVAMQLRDESITEHFLQELKKRKLKVYTFSSEMLSEKLISGFFTYVITV